jgi:putative DNA primase/helicase
MSKNNKVTPPEAIDEQSVDPIKKLSILPDAQPSKSTKDDIDQPSLDILSQNVPKISSEEAKAIINNIAKLPELDYQLARIDTAKFLNVTLNAFDKLVKNVKNELDENTQSLVVDTKPSSEPVLDIALIVSLIYQILEDHIACTDAVKVSATLWILMTWLVPASDVLPIAWINAPEKRCGKSTLLTLMSLLSKKSLSTSNITKSALYRCIEAYTPTLFIDEVDTFINDDKEMRGILNAGHSLEHSKVLRCVGDDNKPVAFNAYGAKAISGIGKIPGTLIDRSISLTLRRKMKNESKKRLRELPIDVTKTIQSQLARWSDDNMLAVKAAKPVLPPHINDRAQDNWEILLKIALVLGDDWLEQAYKACIEISGLETEEPSLNEQLLADIQTVFNLHGTDRLLSKNLLAGLCRDPEMIWSTLNHGKPITLRQIAKRLSGFKISSKDMRTRDLRGNEARGKGYDVRDFEDAFSRYLSHLL